MSPCTLLKLVEEPVSPRFEALGAIEGVRLAGWKLFARDRETFRTVDGSCAGGLAGRVCSRDSTGCRQWIEADCVDRDTGGRVHPGRSESTVHRENRGRVEANGELVGRRNAGGNASLGTIDASGMYSAPEFPPTPNSITISAVETANTRELGNASATLNNPVPHLSSVAPLSVAQGVFSITLTGLHFAQGAVAYMGTTALATTYVSSTQLMAAGTATSAQAGTQTITVHNPDPGASISAGVSFIVQGGVAVTVRAGSGHGAHRKSTGFHSDGHRSLEPERYLDGKRGAWR